MSSNYNKSRDELDKESQEVMCKMPLGQKREVSLNGGT